VFKEAGGAGNFGELGGIGQFVKDVQSGKTASRPPE